MIDEKHWMLNRLIVCPAVSCRQQFHTIQASLSKKIIGGLAPRRANTAGTMYYTLRHAEPSDVALIF